MMLDGASKLYFIAGEEGLDIGEELKWFNRDDLPFDRKTERQQRFLNRDIKKKTMKK